MSFEFQRLTITIDQSNVDEFNSQNQRQSLKQLFDNDYRFRQSRVYQINVKKNNDKHDENEEQKQEQNSYYDNNIYQKSEHKFD